MKKELKLNQDQKAAFDFIINRIATLTKVTKNDAQEVLGVIGDLIWDWDKSEYDLYGLQIEELLEAIGESRRPKEKGL